MTSLNYDALRAQTLGAGDDEAVTVNTRALIDKVLARYSGEWTTLRELLQNAADAGAQKVTIRLETLPSRTVPAPQNTDPLSALRHSILHHTLKTIIVENDGQVFRATDWSRLKKIAEGNPDETKIGAFGVGFYSVFADCEEPFVSSGNEALAFYWKGDALYTRSLRLSTEQTSKTTFVLPMRDTTSSLPSLLSLCQFLTNSLTFVGLQHVELRLDEWRILTLAKKAAPGTPIAIPKELNRKTADGIMHIEGVQRESAQVDACWLKAMEWKPQSTQRAQGDGSSHGARAPQASQSLRSFFSRLAPSNSKTELLERQAKEEREKQTQIAENLLEESRATLFTHVDKATLRATTSKSFSEELERATKKPPPRSTTIALLGASYDEAEASSTGPSGQDAKIFESFAPREGKGRIFIGFTTNQTTGLSIHISAPSVIPTVEREAIDLNNRFVRQWNVELLRAAGIVARVTWGQEMSDLKARMQRLPQDEKTIGRVSPAAVYAHKTFGWLETTPSSEVGALMEESFWICNQKTPIATLSTKGVMPSSSIRREPEDGLGFVQGIPVVPQVLAGTRLIQKLFDYGIIQQITVADIKRELENKALDSQQLRSFLEWLTQKVRNDEMDKAAVGALLGVAVANDDESGKGSLLVLSEMRNFLNTSRIPASMPIPPTTLPFHLTKKMTKHDLELLGFEDLQMVPWLRWLLDHSATNKDHDPTVTPTFAAAVLAIISKQWDGLSSSSKTTILEMLSQRTVMPTKTGMKKPSDAYFPSVKLFDDLPTLVALPAVKEKFLVGLGVRKTINIEVVFDRLMNDRPAEKSSNQAGQQSIPKWSHMDLVKYLVSVRGDIPAEDIKRLKTTKICPAEAEDSGPTQDRFLLSDLFEPNKDLKALGFRTMHWSGPYRPRSDEGRFLTALGLRTAPTYLELVEIMSKSATAANWTLRDLAMKYLIEQHQANGYGKVDLAAISVPYLPIQGLEGKTAIPSQVFVNERASVLGFDILRRDLQVHAPKFGVKQDPPGLECVRRILSKPPLNVRAAREVFTYMASRVGDLTSQEKEALGNALIIPILKKSIGSDTSKYRHSSPRMCFLGSGDQYSEIFDFVDFGDAANPFLLACGSKHEPSTVELTKRLIAEPAGIYSTLGDGRYLDLLRAIAAAWKTLKKDKTLARDLKAANCLLAYREVVATTTPENDQDDDYEDESGVKLWQLASAPKIVIIDDFNVFYNFRSTLLAAPQEEALEELYFSLGASQVSALVEEQPRLGPKMREQAPAARLQQLILERTRLFLSDYPPEKIKHNFAWLQKHLTVECVQSISMRWSLRGYNVVKNANRTAMITSDKPVLYISAGGFSMVDVSSALVPLLLHRAGPQPSFVLEMFLQSSLKQLRSRGYNVDRILRAKAAEARIAEDARKKQLEEEQQRIKAQEQDWEKAQAVAAAAHQTGQDSQMPGVFPPSPDHKDKSLVPANEGELARQRKNGGLFSGISKHFNFDTVKRGMTQAQQRLPIQDQAPEVNAQEALPPPPYTPEAGQRPVTQAQPPLPESATAPHHLQRNLMNAVQASRGYNSSQLESQPAVTDVKETSTYCDAKPGHNIRFVGSAGALRVFLSNDIITQDSSNNAVQKFLAANTTALNQFASVLLDCAASFALRQDAVHIFYDTSGSTIGFNQSKALFFNYRYFENLHLPAVQQGKRAEAIVYWAVVMAHELAHNLVADHSAQHSFYTESLIAQYFEKIAIKAAAPQQQQQQRVEDPAPTALKG